MSNPNKDAVDFTNLIKDKFTMRKDIAPVETSSSASRAYKVGEQFYYGNLLQRATQDIAQGTGLAGGVNFENADPVITTIQNLSTVVSKNGAKNLLPYPYYGTKGGVKTTNNLTITENADGSITVNGTASATTYVDLTPRTDYLKAGNYILSGGASANRYFFINLYNNSSMVRTLIKNQATGDSAFTINYSDYDSFIVGFAIASGEVLNNVTFYPMIRLATDTDSTWQSPAMTNQQLTTDKVGMDLLSEVGAVNYAPNNATTQTINGATFTVNSDKTITASGTHSNANAQSLMLYSRAASNLTVGKTYKLSNGLATSLSNCNLVLTFYNSSSTQLLEVNCPSGEVVFTVPSGTTQMQLALWFKNTAFGSGTVFKPMICPVEYTGLYAPYAKTNGELTEFVSDLSTLNNASQIVVADSTICTIGSVILNKKGNILSGFIAINCVTDLPYNVTLFTLPTGFRPAGFTNCLGLENTTNDPIMSLFGIWDNGQVQLQLGKGPANRTIRVSIAAIV